MTVAFLDAAEYELDKAIEYYNLQQEGLGMEFAVEVKRGLSRIIQYPSAWAILSQRTRRCILSRFPYALLYQVRENEILIVAVQHMHQHPETWRSRLNKDK